MPSRGFPVLSDAFVTGGGGGGFTLGPETNTFADDAARDTYATANADWLTLYNDNRDFFINVGTEYQRRNVAGDDWEVVTNLLQGRDGSKGDKGDPGDDAAATPLSDDETLLEAPAATADAGDEDEAARVDHVHPEQDLEGKQDTIVTTSRNDILTGDGSGGVTTTNLGDRQFLAGTTNGLVGRTVYDDTPPEPIATTANDGSQPTLARRDHIHAQQDLDSTLDNSGGTLGVADGGINTDQLHADVQGQLVPDYETTADGEVITLVQGVVVWEPVANLITNIRGWIPVFSIQENGEERVYRLEDYTGGTGTKPTDHIGEYIGSTGFVTDINDAVDIRGPAGSGSGGGGTGEDGDNGWSPRFSIQSDGDRRVMRIEGYVGGEGTAPTLPTAANRYVTSSGYGTLANAIDVRGIQGLMGDDGHNGWSPRFSVREDGERRVLYLEGYVGGTGTSPTQTNRYVGEDGYVSSASQATDIRGATGPGGVSEQDVTDKITEHNDSDTAHSNQFDNVLTTSSNIGEMNNVNTAGATEGQVLKLNSSNIWVPANDDTGSGGGTGNDGDDGWSPTYSIRSDGQRRVLYLEGYIGGEGTAPALGSNRFVGSSGYVSSASQAVDIRGAQGLQGNDGDDGQRGDDGQDGEDGDNGWSPSFAIVSSGSRRVLQVESWQGGSGTRPAPDGSYLASTGFTTNINNAVDIRGVQGLQGDDGNDGMDGEDGNAGWSPRLAVVTDGERRVLQVVSWEGGEGTEPTSGLYLGATDLVSDIANAVDIRGEAGSGGGGGTGVTFPSINAGEIYTGPLSSGVPTTKNLFNNSTPSIVGSSSNRGSSDDAARADHEHGLQFGNAFVRQSGGLIELGNNSIELGHLQSGVTNRMAPVINSGNDGQVLVSNGTSLEFQNIASGSIATLNSVGNVTITSPQDGQAVVWSSSADNGNGAWINMTITSGTPTPPAQDHSLFMGTSTDENWSRFDFNTSTSSTSNNLNDTSVNILQTRNWFSDTTRFVGVAVPTGRTLTEVYQVASRSDPRRLGFATNQINNMSDTGQDVSLNDTEHRIWQFNNALLQTASQYWYEFITVEA